MFDLKKIFGTLLSLALLPTITVSADEYINEGSVGLFANEDFIGKLETSIYEGDRSSYSFLFGTSDIVLDFEHTMLCYGIDYQNTPNAEKFSDLLIPYSSCCVPALDSNNNFIGYAEFAPIVPYEEMPESLEQYEDEVKKHKDHSGEWEIVSASVGNWNEPFYAYITTENSVNAVISSYPQAYLIYAAGPEGILLTSDTDELYFDYTGFGYAAQNSSFDITSDSEAANYFYSSEQAMAHAEWTYSQYFGENYLAAGYDDGISDDTFEIIVEEPQIEEESENTADSEEETRETIIYEEETEEQNAPASEADEDVPNPETGTYFPACLAALLVISGCAAAVSRKRK